MFIGTGIYFLLMTGVCGIAAAIADPEYSSNRLGQHLGMGALLALFSGAGFVWLLKPLFSLISGGWLAYQALSALLVMLIAVPLGMFMYSLDFHQGRIFGLAVAIGYLLIGLSMRWVFSG